MAVRASANPTNPASHQALAPLVLNIPEWTRLLHSARSSLPLGRADALLSAITTGVGLPLKPGVLPPASFRPAPNLRGARPELRDHDPLVSLKILESLKTEVELGRMAGPFFSPPLHNLQISPVGAVPKKDSTKLRLIEHLSWPRDGSATSVNEMVEEVECVYLRFDSVLRRIGELGRDTLLAKFDIRDAFRLLRIRVEDQFLFKLQFFRFYFYERCMPFGAGPAPGLFEQFATAINVFSTTAGIRDLVHYADDFLLLTDEANADREYNMVLDLFARLGAPLAIEKLAPPAPVVEFLGILIDVPAMRISLPLDKLRRYKSHVDAALCRRRCTEQELESLLGVLRYAARIIQHGRAYTFHLQAALTAAAAAAHTHTQAASGATRRPSGIRPSGIRPSARETPQSLLSFAPNARIGVPYPAGGRHTAPSTSGSGAIALSLTTTPPTSHRCPQKHARSSSGGRGSSWTGMVPTSFLHPSLTSLSFDGDASAQMHAIRVWGLV